MDGGVVVKKLGFLLVSVALWPLNAVGDESSPEAVACLAEAGQIGAGVPVGPEAAAARKARLVAAMPHCLDAAKAEGASAEVLFAAAEISHGRRDASAAFAYLSRAVELGSAPAETRMGDYYLFGAAPGGKNPAKAVVHYQRAAEMGDAAGMTTLAMLYRAGKGVPRDAARMVSLLDAAAAQGYHFAAYRLGQTFLTGEGIPGRADAELGIPDPVRAAQLLTVAADAGNVTAALELAKLYGDPRSGLPDNPEEQARLTRMASRKGVPEAIAAMGVLYETGRGVGHSPEIAAGLYVKAMETGEVAFEDLRAGGPRWWDDDTARAFQVLLADRGLYRSYIDGVVGPGTAAAARALAGE